MKNLPTPPSLSLSIIGPGLVLVAMGLGSGEYILWPYLIATAGFGVMWGVLLGMTIQYVLSHEAGRYTLATGNSIYVGFSKLSRVLPAWFILSTLASFIWPGIIGSGGQILGYILGIDDHKWLTIAMLVVIGLLLTVAGKVYDRLERVQSLIIFFCIPALFLLAVHLVDQEVLIKLGEGFFGKGEGYFLLPANISLNSFLGAIAYAGAAGNLVLAHSFYLQDKGFGMAYHAHSQIDSDSRSKSIPHGELFTMNRTNLDKFNKWFKLTGIEQLITFWFIGVVGIVFLALIAYQLLYPFSGEETLNFIFLQAQGLSARFTPGLGVFFLAVGVVFLFKTQLGVFEATSRIVTENIQLVFGKWAHQFKRSHIFYTAVWAQVTIAAAISLTEIRQPIQILIISTLFSAISTLALTGLVLWLNTSRLLPKEIQPSLLKKLCLLAGFIFYLIFVIAVVRST